MSTANPRSASATPAPLASLPNGTSSIHAHDDPPLTNGHHHHHHHHHHAPVQDPRPAPTPTPAMTANAAAKKSKGKKALDSSEASKLVAARISQLEVDTAAEKEQEAEIGRFTPRLLFVLKKAWYGVFINHLMCNYDSISIWRKRCWTSDIYISIKVQPINDLEHMLLPSHFSVRGGCADRRAAAYHVLCSVASYLPKYHSLELSLSLLMLVGVGSWLTFLFARRSRSPEGKS